MKLLFVSLGCDKNRVDTERMLGLILAEEWDEPVEFTDDEYEADVIVVNSCCFINDAKEESVNTILEMAERKKDGRAKAVIVTGCLAERYRDEIRREIPEVDAVLGTGSVAQIASAIRSACAGRFYQDFAALTGLPERSAGRVVTTGGHFAYLKIAEGCDKRCTYCIIPSIRGSYRSVPLPDLIAEAEELVAGGVKELILVAQETTLYGTDLYGEKSLHRLLDALNEIPGLFWIRILYCYPEEIYDGLLDAMLRNKKVCHYLDLPIQHASDRILKRMGRRTDRAQLERIIERLRQEIPDICLRTTLITGFPGETKEDHEQLLDFIDRMEFDRLGVFTYSQEEDTPAALMEDQIEEEVKQKRFAELMELQQEIAFAVAEDMVGRVVTAVVEGRVADENAYVARTYRDAPGVDGLLFVNTERELITGDFVKVRVSDVYEYDLMGVLEDEFTE